MPIKYNQKPEQMKVSSRFNGLLIIDNRWWDWNVNFGSEIATINFFFKVKVYEPEKRLSLAWYFAWADKLIAS